MQVDDLAAAGGAVQSIDVLRDQELDEPERLERASERCAALGRACAMTGQPSMLRDQYRCRTVGSVMNGRNSTGRARFQAPSSSR